MSKRRISRKPSYIVSDDDDDDFVFAAKRPKSSSQSSQEIKAQKKKVHKAKTTPKIEKEIHQAVEESLTLSSRKKVNVIHSDSDDDFLLDRVKKSERSKIKKEPSQEYVPSSRESEVSSQETACLEEEEEEDPCSGSDSDYSGESDYETKKVKGVVVQKKHTVSPKLKNVPRKKVITNLTKVSTPNIPSTTQPVEQQVTKVPTLSTPVRPPPKQRPTPTNKAHTSVHSTINIPTLISSSPTQSPLNIKLGLSKRAKFKPLHAKVQNKLP